MRHGKTPLKAAVVDPAAINNVRTKNLLRKSNGIDSGDKDKIYPLSRKEKQQGPLIE